MAQRPDTYKQFYEQLQQARDYDETITQQTKSGELLQTYKGGKAIAGAYEQLRNATELGEGNITIQRAMRRFYKRSLFITHIKPEKIGQELLIELSLSGYIREGNYGEHAAQMIAALVSEHAAIYQEMRNSKVAQKQAMSWTLAVLSVKTYNLLLPHTYDLVIAAFAYQYFLEELPKELFVKTEQENTSYNDALYVAVQQTLLQADIDVVRTNLLHAHNQNGSDIHGYIDWNTYAKDLYISPLTLRLRRAVSRNGAPFRILRSLVAANTPGETILQRDLFLQAYHGQINTEYRKIRKRLDTGVFKSIVFLFLTKVAIGLAVEVPFDRYLYGHIKYLPLTINLLFPPLYMASIRLGLSIPSTDNAAAVADFMDRLLYGEVAPTPKLPKSTARSANARLGYGILFFVPFVITYFILNALNFNPLQMAIFIVFFSTASFLGYRLSLMIREFRMARSDSGIFAMLRDLFYLPYIQLGQWIASKYTEINVIGEVLDLVIELPLKTVLSLFRQWARFLREKHDELY